MSCPFKSTLLLAALLVVSPIAFAEGPAGKSAVVSYSDLDLSRPAGVETLLKRINVASRKVCGKRPMSPRWGGVERYLACRDEAISGAIGRIGVPAVTVAFETTKSVPGARLATR